VSRRQFADLRRARKQSDLWLDLEEVGRLICHSQAELCQRGVAYFNFAHWQAATGREAPTRDALHRAFERWKTDVRNVVGYQFVPPPESLGNSYYGIELAAVQASVLPAIEHAERLAEAYQAMRGRPAPPRRVPKKKYVRGQTLKQVSAGLGVSEGCIYKWMSLGLPYDDLRKPGSKKGVNRFSLDEVRAWAMRRKAEGHQIEMGRKRVPIGPARERLLEIREFLGLSQDRMAELLGVKAITFKVYLGTGGPWKKTTTVPQEVVDRAEALLDTELASPFSMTRLQRISCDDFVSAWEKGGGTVRGAAVLLEISRESARKLADMCGVYVRPQAEPVVLRVDSADVKRAMAEHDNVIAAAGRSLGLSPSGMAIAIKEYGLTFPIRKAGRRPRTITAEKLKPLIAEGRSLAYMARKIGASKSGVKKAIKDLGLTDWEPAVHPREHQMTREELAGILDDAKARGIKISHLARDIGIPSPAWKRLAAKHGLEAELEALRTTAHRGKTKGIDAGATRAILEDALALGLSANQAGKKAGFASGRALALAAKRHGLTDLYKRVIARKNPPRHQATPGLILTAWLGKKKVGWLDLDLGGYGEGGVARVHYVNTEEGYQRQYVATTLYEHAAAEAFSRGLQLASDDMLYPETKAFWEKQVRKGRATWTDPEPGEDEWDEPEHMGYFALQMPPPPSLRNPPRRFDVRSPGQGLRAIQHPVITKNYEKALRVKPKHKKAVLARLPQRPRGQEARRLRRQRAARDRALRVEPQVPPGPLRLPAGAPSGRGPRAPGRPDRDLV
jgi:DNA-directed RNA polymerase specialized sigma24 family protein/transcriptional regulator with XRE-family HTH domain